MTSAHPLHVAPLDALLGVRRACAEVVARFEFFPVRTDDDATILANSENAIERIDQELQRREEIAERLLDGVVI